MTEEISEMQFKDLPALTDSIKNDMGTEQATAFQAQASAALSTLLSAVQQGKTQLADDLDNLRSAFQTLDQMRAIPSTERNVLSNLGSATAASGVGQMLGRATGTEAQVERDVINSARMRLVNSIKNATGMSAQQLNSNVELQTMLKSISDPGQSVEAAMRIIDDIDNAYVKNNNALPKRNKPAVAAPNIDALLNKYK
jgi:predicted  nucleic acid-binding Zn-ribbon protein